jgi:hypothetical protein
MATPRAHASARTRACGGARTTGDGAGACSSGS